MKFNADKCHVMEMGENDNMVHEECICEIHTIEIDAEKVTEYTVLLNKALNPCGVSVNIRGSSILHPQIVELSLISKVTIPRIYKQL